MTTPPGQINCPQFTTSLPVLGPPGAPPPPNLLTTWTPWAWVPGVPAALALQLMWTSASSVAVQLSTASGYLRHPPSPLQNTLPLASADSHPQSQTCWTPSCTQTPPQRQREREWWLSWWVWVSAAPGRGWSRPCLQCHTARCAWTKPSLCHSSGTCRVLWCSDFHAHLWTDQHNQCPADTKLPPGLASLTGITTFVSFRTFRPRPQHWFRKKS